jgi:hypothetical protein
VYSNARSARRWPHRQGAFLASATKLLSSCPVRTAAVTVKVSVDGKIRELSRRELPNDSNACARFRPEGLIQLRSVAIRPTLGDYFAAM